MKRYKEVYLMLTELCPNRCEYCYIKGRDIPKSMTENQIDEIIRVEDPTRIIFFGGEPLVRLDLIKKIMPKYFGKIKFQVITSTSANFKEFLDFNIICPMSEFQLSWDGFSKKNRVNVAGQSISNEVWDNIIYAADRGYRFDIKCVVGNENIELLPEIHNTFKELNKKYPGVRGEFVLAHRSVYTDKYLDLFKKYYKETFDLDFLYLEHINKITAVLQNDKQYASCDAGKYTIYTPSGKKCYCTALSQEEEDFNSEVLQRPCYSDECKDCKYACVCDGGCRYERFLKFGDKWKDNHTKATCQMTKIIYDTINEWVDSLSYEDYNKLYEIIKDAKRRLIIHDSGYEGEEYR